ncbi:hypothetical protein [Xanthocytophaga agilis]|uniref:BON domain-containing protein n=1 Tax=Xanthocytophaga agilis TaxID=3048010 RepID=A0AAE3RD88_9BACT|nr:BON domain-containing protein [Xanthocytophaga agilis]
MQIQKDVMDQLRWNPLLNAAEIGVAVKNGIVTLSVRPFIAVLQLMPAESILK